MSKIEVFEPPMCCSSGVCGPKVDTVLVQFAADLQGFQRQGATVQRYNLAQTPLAFAQNKTVREALAADENCLPIVLVDGKTLCSGKYPAAVELATALGVAAPAIEAPGKRGRCCGVAAAKGGCC
jgi:hypothetical protein